MGACEPLELDFQCLLWFYMTVLLCDVSSFFQQIFLGLLQYSRPENKKTKGPMAGESHGSTIKM